MGIYDLRLPPSLSKTITRIVDRAEKNQVLTLRFRHSRDGDFYTIDAGDEPDNLPALTREALLALQELGFIRLLQEEDIKGMRPGIFLLAEKAYAWEHHYRKGRVGRGWERAQQIGRETAPLVVGIAAMILTLLQILQALGIL